MPQTALTDDAKYTIPEGREPGEFLVDADLAEYHRRRLEAAPDGDRLLPELQVNARMARRAAAQTAEAIADATAQAEAELAGAVAEAELVAEPD